MVSRLLGSQSPRKPHTASADRSSLLVRSHRCALTRRRQENRRLTAQNPIPEALIHRRTVRSNALWSDPHEYMRIGIHHGQAFPETNAGTGPIVATLRQIAADDFFDTVSVPPISDRSVRKEADELLRSSGLLVNYTVGGA